MYSKEEEINLLFETSWEVCNKVGGIYTVLSTKASSLRNNYKDKLIFIGPDVWTESNPCPCFTESKTLLRKWRENGQLPGGVNVRVGRWEIPGRPIAILVSFAGMYADKDRFYGEMWSRYGVDSLHAYGDYDEGCAFAHAAGIVIESIVKFNDLENGRVIAHFDEWTTGMGLLYVKSVLPHIATIFTTHATSIGRSICGNGKPLYEYFKNYDGDQMAGELNMQSKHSLEKATAINADCFTTVSDITADECEQLLGRRPDVVTPNGFEENFVPAPRFFKSRRAAARKHLLDVVAALTGVQLDDSTFIMATSGRCEYRNKGLDLYLDAVSRLGELDPKRRVLAFVMVPGWVKEPRKDLEDALEKNETTPLPDPVITHTLNNYETDPIINRIHQIYFENDHDSRIFTVYVPSYLNGTDGIFDKRYYDLLIGMDATVFASYYEPWGYTPLESIAFGVPTVTTSLSGFGRWIMANYDKGFEKCGVEVIERNDTNYDSAKEKIALALKSLIAESPETRKAISTAATTTSHDAAWQSFITYYIKAFDIALDNAAKRNLYFLINFQV